MKNRDYIELLKFQRNIYLYGKNISEMSRDLQNAADEASFILTDTVSEKTIGKLREYANNLNLFGKHIIEKIEPEIQKTMKEIERFEAL